MARNEEKICFVIGRMGDYMPRLNTLALEVVKPLVEPLGYRVETPDQPRIGKIMNHVVEMLDRADLVIADITEANANVLYELGIRHALGAAYIMVTETPDKVPFDIRECRFQTINLDKPAEAMESLRAMVVEADANILNFNHSNPVTQFFNAPITSTAPAVGLAVGYYVNFLMPVLGKITAMRPDMSAYENDIAIKESTNPDANTIYSFGTALDGRDKLKVQVLIPPETKHMAFNSLGQVRARELAPGIIQSQPRPFTIYARQEGDTYNIVDFPTPLNAIDDAITNRLGPGAVGTETWFDLERREIKRFYDELTRWVAASEPAMRKRVEVYRYTDDDTPPQIEWLRKHWGEDS